MGLFDLRCCVSRMSTSWLADEEHVHTCSIALLEECDGAWLPLTPAISGVYNHYGTIELWPQHAGEHPAWVGETLRRLWDRGRLQSEDPDDFDHRRSRVTDLPFRVPDDPAHVDVVAFLAHASSSVFNHFALTIDGNPVRPWLCLDVVAEAIHDESSRDDGVASSLAELYRDGQTGRDLFTEPPAESQPALARFAAVVAWERARDGLRVITADDSAQHSKAQIRGFVRRAWQADRGPLRALVDRHNPRWSRSWAKKERDRERLDAPDARPYRPRESFAVDTAIEHPTFGRGLVERATADKIWVRFRDGERILVHGRG